MRLAVSVGLVVVAVSTTACGSSPRVTSNFPVALHRLLTAKRGVVRTRLEFVKGEESIPPIDYVTTFDKRQRRIETRIDFRKFIRAYNATLAPGERFGKPDEWRLDVLVDKAHNATVYLSSPLFSDRMRKKWIKLSSAQLAARSAQLGSGLAAQLAEVLPDVNSPFSYFKALGKRAVPAKGLDRIDGAETRGYSETVDFRPYLRVLPGFMQKILAGSSTKMDAVIWVDGTSNVRRIELLSAPIRGADGALMSDVTDVDQLGGRVRIQIPPATDVLDAASLPKTWRIKPRMRGARSARPL